jgi:hypothetical protein
VNVATAGLLERPAPAALLRREGLLVCLLAWAAFVSIPLSLGGIALTWDTLNHHVYLGWTAQQQRFDRDFLGAGYQSFTSPYLYWPLYRMAIAGWSGLAAGVLLASLHVVVVWPLWMLARVCVPGPTVFDVTMRALAVALGLFSGLVLSVFGTTLNDLLAATPLVWSVALAMQPAARTDMPLASARRYVLWSGLCAGLSVALKLSNGPLAILLPALWLFCARGLVQRMVMAVLGGLATIVAFVVGYAPWGWLLWRYYGNPLFPFNDHWFAPLRALVGWAG